jgi:large repetitive protein
MWGKSVIKRISVVLTVTMLAGLLPMPSYAGASGAKRVAVTESFLEGTGQMTSGNTGILPDVNRAAANIAAPTNGLWLNPVEDEVALMWGGVQDSVSYAVYRQGEYIGSTLQPEFTDSGLPERSSLKYEIHSVDAKGNASAPLEIYAGTSTRGETMVSGAEDGTPGRGEIRDFALSGDGWTVAFVSKATNLLPGVGDENYGALYIRNLRDNILYAGIPEGESVPRNIGDLHFSRDGRFLVFTGEDELWRSDVYLLDLAAHSLVNLTEEANGDSFAESISDQGDRIVIFSNASNLPGVPYGTRERNMYLYDRVSGDYTPIPVEDFDDYWPSMPSLSGNGKAIVYRLFPQDNGKNFLFYYDMEAESLRMIAENTGDPSISRDGRAVAYSKDYSVYLYDAETDTETKVLEGTRDGVSYRDASISADGKHILVANYSDGIEADYRIDNDGMYWKDLESGQVRIVGHPAGYQDDPVMSADGSRLLYGGYYTALRDEYGWFAVGLLTVCPVVCGDGVPYEHPVERVVWAASEGTFRQQIKLGSDVNVEAWGAPGGQAKATAIYDMGDGSTSGSNLVVELEEDTRIPGHYAGSFPIPEGAERIRSIQVAITDSLGRTASRYADRLPARVTGGVQATLTSTDPSVWEGGRLAAWSSSLGAGGQTTVIGGQAPKLALPEADDYRLSLFSAGGQLLGEASQVSLQDGRWTEAAIHVPISAYLDVEITNEQGQSVSGAEITISRVADGSVSGYGFTGSNGKARIWAGTEGEEVQAAVTYLRPYRSPEPVRMVLGRTNSLKRTAPIYYGTISGVVTGPDGHPVPNILVRGHVSMADGNSFVTGSDGSYSLRLPEGEANIYVVDSEPGRDLNMSKVAPVIVRADEDQRMDLTVNHRIKGTLRLALTEQLIDRQPVSIKLDSTFYVLYRITMRNSEGEDLQITYDDTNLLQFSGVHNPDQPIQVCVEDRVHGTATVCEMVSLDEENHGAVEMEMKEHSAVSGVLELDPVWDNAVITATLIRLDEEGRTVGTAWSQRIPGERFRIGVAEAGSYELRIQATRNGYLLSAIVPFVTEEGRISDVGKVPLSTRGTFHFAPGNRLEALTREAVPGGQIALRGTFRNNEDSIDRAILQMLAPSGMAVVPESVTLNGQPVDPSQLQTVGSKGYELEIGRLDSGAEGTIAYQLKIIEPQEEYASAELRIRFWMGGYERTDIVGETRIPASELTLHAPALVVKKQIRVDGSASPGSRIVVLEGEQVIGETTASPTGSWLTTVTLGDSSENGMYALHAQSIKDGKVKESGRVLVQYDPTLPHPMEMTMTTYRHSFAKSEMKADLTEGIARFPYVVDPSRPIEMTVSFSNPSRVEHVKLHVANEEIPLVYNPMLNRFAGVKTSKHENLGGIWVSYDLKPAYDDRELTNEELLEKLPKGLRGLKGVVTQIEQAPLRAAADARVNVASVSISSEEFPGEKIDVNYYYEPLPGHQPDPLPEGAPPVYDFKYRWNSDGSVDISAIVPAEHASAAMAKLTGGTVLALAAEVEAVVRVGANIKFEIKTPGSGSALGLLSTIKNGYDFQSKMGELDGMLNQVMGADCMPPHYNQYYADRLQDMADQLMRNLLTKYSLQVAGMALAASGIGLLGGAAVLATSVAIGVKLDYEWNKQFEELQQEFQADQGSSDCEDEDDNTDRDPPPRPPEDPRRDPDVPNRDPDAEPSWIYDPSGYVYEAVPSNRLQGVTATALQKQPDGSWKMWDAEWYLQKNPVVSGGDGRYGWDVPEGQWQVVYHKDGYMEARSDVLTVLPPHTDVNVGMVSYEAPQVDWTWVENGGAALRLNFSKYMLPESITDEAVQVKVSSSGAVISGVLEPVDPEPDSKGKPLARSFRFTPEQPLAAGETYRLEVNSMVLSYAGVPMVADYTADVKVEAEQPVEEAASELNTTPGIGGYVVRWQESPAPWVASYVLRWRSKTNPADYGEVTAVPGSGAAVASGLSEGADYEFRLHTVSLEGRESVGIAVEGTTLAVVKPAADTSPPGLVTDAAALIESGRLTVSWIDPTDIDLRRVRLQARMAGANEFADVIFIEPGTQAWFLEGLTAKGTYTVRLATEDIRGNVSEPIEVQAEIQSPDDDPPGNSDGGGGGGEPTPSPDPNAAVVQVERGRVHYRVFDGQAELHLPASELPVGTEIRFTRTVQPDSGLPANYKAVSALIKLESEADLSGNASLLLSYHAGSLKGADRRRLGVYRLDANAPSGWTYVGGAVRPADNTIRIKLKEWGTYAVFLYDRSFSDLNGHWGQSELEVLISRHILQGVSDKVFEPEKPITRAEIVKILLDLRQEIGAKLSDAGASRSTSFTDVSAGDWYAPYVATAIQAGLVEGADGKFRPNDPVSRQELAVMLHRAFDALQIQTNGADSLAPFADAGDIAAWARPSMAAAVRAGIMNGISDTELVPLGRTTRAEAGVMALRLLVQTGLIEFQ